MRIKTFLVPLIAGTIFLSACKQNAISLAYTNAKGEVPQLGNLIFRFNQFAGKRFHAQCLGFYRIYFI